MEKAGKKLCFPVKIHKKQQKALFYDMKKFSIRQLYNF